MRDKVRTWGQVLILLLACSGGAAMGDAATPFRAEAVGDALLSPAVTAQSVAPLLGTLGAFHPGYYAVAPRDPAILEARIGFNADASEAPSYVQVNWKDGKLPKLGEIALSCRDWRLITNTPEGSFWLYGCRYGQSTKEITVDFIVTLTGDIKDPASRAQRLTFQRGDWR